MRCVRLLGAPNLRPLQQGAQQGGDALRLPHVPPQRCAPSADTHSEEEPCLYMDRALSGMENSLSKIGDDLLS